MTIFGQRRMMQKRLSQAFVALITFPQLLQIWIVLLNLRAKNIINSSLDLSRRKPITWKHLGCYLSISLSAAQRAAILHHTYGFIDQLNKKSLEFRLRDRAIIWSRSGDDIDCSIGIGPSSLAPMEGEIALTFVWNAQILYTMSFSIAPGRVFGISAADVIVIGGLQGAPASRVAIRNASKKLQEVAPQDMLVVAVRALAKVLDVGVIAGVASDGHIPTARRTYDYDGFWERIGAVRTDCGFYILSPDGVCGPSSAVSSAHRSRAKRKRRFRADLQREIEVSFLRCLRTNYNGRSPSIFAARPTGVPVDETRRAGAWV